MFAEGPVPRHAACQHVFLQAQERITTLSDSCVREPGCFCENKFRDVQRFSLFERAQGQADDVANGVTWEELYELRHFPSAYYLVTKADGDTNAGGVHVMSRTFSRYARVEGAEEIASGVYILCGGRFGSVVICCDDLLGPACDLRQASGRLLDCIHSRSRGNCSELSRPVANRPCRARRCSGRGRG